MEIAKALILAGGSSQQPAWAALSVTRPLFPVGNRPILCHNLEALRKAGVLEVAILSDRDAAAPIRRFVGDGSEWGLHVVHGEWEPSGGLGAGLSAMNGFIADEPVLVEQGDALLRGHMHGAIAMFARERLDALALRVTTPDTTRHDELTPGYLLSPRAVSILRDGGHAAEPLEGVRAHGGRVGVAQVPGCFPWGGDADALIAGNRCAMEGLEADVSPGSLEDSTVHGAVSVHPTAHVQRSLLRGPVIIGPGARIVDAYIGPYTAIGAGVIVEGAEIEHSIVLPGAELRFIGTRLESSIIGRGARVVRGFHLPAAIRVTLGDGAEVVLR